MSPGPEAHPDASRRTLRIGRTTPKTLVRLLGTNYWSPKGDEYGRHATLLGAKGASSSLTTILWSRLPSTGAQTVMSLMNWRKSDHPNARCRALASAQASRHSSNHSHWSSRST